MRITTTATALSVLAMTTAGAAAGCHPLTNSVTTTVTTPATAGTSTVDRHTSDVGPAFQAECGNGDQVIRVYPDTPATRKAAAHACAVTDQDENRVARQLGLTPAPLHQVARH